MSDAPARLVMLGIDAANPDLLERWAADGTLPNLARLIARGTVSRMKGVEGFSVGSTWPSMYTGTDPSRHGVHYLLQLVPGTYDLHWVAEAAFVRRSAFWDALSAAGRRVAILDVPLTRLTSGLNGVQVVEWGGHDSIYGFRTFPAELAEELRARHGLHPVEGSCDRSNRTREDFAQFVEALEAGVARKADWTIELLERSGWDLLVQVFTESHCAGHQCWHLHDATHPMHDPEFAATHGDPLLRVYRAIDEAIGRVVARAGNARVIVFTAHGMAHRFGAQFLLRDILVRLGVTVAQHAGAPTEEGIARHAARWLWRRLPRGLRESIGKPRVEPKPAGAVPRLRIDPRASKCFPLNNGLAVGGIRLNLAGREPHGILQPGQEAEAFTRRLTADLLAIVDDATGRPLVRRVVATRDLYNGDGVDDLPDLLVEWDDATPIETSALGDPSRGRLTARSPKIGTVTGVNDYARTGEHRPDGWFVAAGPGIAQSRIPDGASLLDLAPTACELLGVTLHGVDGRPIPHVLPADSPPPTGS
jgi:predicted AlkP superfamily phosphohydrolase/phosphomutase